MEENEKSASHNLHLTEIHHFFPNIHFLSSQRSLLLGKEIQKKQAEVQNDYQFQNTLCHICP